MSFETGSPGLKAFIRSYNWRRRAAITSCAGLAAVGLLSYTKVIDQTSTLAYWLWATALIFYVLANWIFAKCPECRRFIGAGGRFQSLNMSMRCDLELACAEALDGR